jgi:hypothetical protein
MLGPDEFERCDSFSICDSRLHYSINAFKTAHGGPIGAHADGAVN